mmetsp:Transcript_33493/g.54651  ORF Transcript_33493/g.54651 Transcript_33493/m.54651 type:complete len:273 (+) Transcript_33493:127-945(+)
MDRLFNSSPMTRFLAHLKTMLATYSSTELYDQALDLSVGGYAHEENELGALSSPRRAMASSSLPSPYTDPRSPSASLLPLPPPRQRPVSQPTPPWRALEMGTVVQHPAQKKFRMVNLGRRVSLINGQRQGITVTGFINLFEFHGFDVPNKELADFFWRVAKHENGGVINKTEFESLCLSISCHDIIQPPPVAVRPPHPAGLVPINEIQLMRLYEDPAGPQQRDPRKAVLEMEPELKDTWQMMFCGGAKPVVAALKKVQAKYKIKLEIESFDW